MNYKKCGLGLVLLTAMCFMACGEDSNPVKGSNDPESSSSVEGNNSQSSAASSSSVSGAVSSSSVIASSSSVAKAEPCSFTATDNTWEISYKGSDSKNSATITTVYEISGDDLIIRDSIRYTGSMTSMMCRIDPDASHSSSDGVFAGQRSCDSDGNTVIYVSTTTQKGYLANNSREDLFAKVQSACQAAVNDGNYDKIIFIPETKCDFAMDDDEWSYFYKDEDLKGDTVPKKKLIFLDPEDGRYVNMNYSIYPMSHIECVSKNFADFNGIHYCSADAYLNIASSSTTFTKETLFEIEQKACKEYLPAVDPNASMTDPETPPSGDMVSCDVPGVMGGCEEAPAGSEEANFYLSSCVTVLEGTLGTGCAK